MTLRMTRRRALGALGAATGLVTLGAPARAATPVNVGALRLASHAPSFIAFERGYFDEAGLNVEFKFFQAAQPMAVAIASGDADYGVTAISGGLISLAQKGAAKVIGGALVEEEGVDGQIILASNDAYAAGLTSPAGLRGKRYGVTTAGSSFHYMGARIAEAEGFGGELTFTPLQKVGALIGALKSGQVDAWSIVPHIAKGLIASGGAKQIGRVADYLPGYQVTTVFTSAASAAGERARTEAFLAAFAKGAEDFNAALVDKTAGDDAAERVLRDIHKYVGADKPADVADAAVRAGAMRISRGAALHMASIEDQLAWFRSENMVGADATAEVLVDPSYVATA